MPLSTLSQQKLPSNIEVEIPEQPSFLKRICNQVKSAVASVYQKGSDYLAARKQEKIEQYEEKLLQQAEKQPSFFEQMRELQKADEREQQIQKMENKLLKKSEELSTLKPKSSTDFSTSFKDFIHQTGHTFAQTLRKKALPAFLGFSTLISATGISNLAKAAVQTEFIGTSIAETQITSRNTWDDPHNRNQLRTNLQNLIKENPVAFNNPETSKAKEHLVKSLAKAYQIEKTGASHKELQETLENAKQFGNNFKKLLNPNYQITINEENPFPNLSLETGSQRNGARLAAIQYLAKFHPQNAQEKKAYSTLRKALRFCTEVETGEYRRAHPEIDIQPTAKQAAAYMLQELKKAQETKVESPDQNQKIEAKRTTNPPPVLQTRLPKTSSASAEIKTNLSIEQASLNAYDWDLIVTSVKDVVALILEVQPKDSHQIAANIEKQEKENQAIINLKWEKNGKSYANGIVIKPKINSKVEHGLCTGENATITLLNKEKPTFNSLLQAAQSIAYNWQ